MKSIVPFGLILLALAPAAGEAETLPEFRPALMTSRHSLINLIDTKGLMKKGQKDAVIFFTAQVASAGRGGNILVIAAPRDRRVSGRNFSAAIQWLFTSRRFSITKRLGCR